MIKHLVKIFTFIICVIALNAQDDSNYYRQFNKNLKTALILFKIDNSYNTSLDLLNLLDSNALNNVASKRFNFFHDGKLYINYGDINSLAGNNRIKLFTFDTVNYRSVKYTGIDSSVIRLYSSIISAQDSLIYNCYEKQKIDVNTYFIRNGDSITLFIVPLWQRTGKIIYGQYHIKKYFLHNNDYTLVEEYESKSGFKVFPEDTEEVYLDYSEDFCPSAVAIFYSLAYKDVFNKLIIETKNKYTLLNDFNLGSYTHMGK